MTRGTLVLGAVLLFVLGAMLTASPALRRRARPALERLGVLQPFQESARYRAILHRHAQENADLAADCLVLLGDSLAEEFPASLAEPRGWAVRGISGDRVRHVLSRIEPSAVRAPCMDVAMLVGSNDLVHDGKPPDQVAGELSDLAGALRIRGKRVVVMTLPPVSGRFAGANDQIRQVNARLRKLGGDRVRVADLHAALADESGALASIFSRDGLHLSRVGYERWASVLERTLAEPWR
jgi:lysophospholipase L1-like esterase